MSMTLKAQKPKDIYIFTFNGNLKIMVKSSFVKTYNTNEKKLLKMLPRVTDLRWFKSGKTFIKFCHCGLKKSPKT